MSNSPAELLQGTLDMRILKALSLRALHGYAISQRSQLAAESSNWERLSGAVSAIMRSAE
jgi:hypothetical protein